jgi:hypothetical protein
MGAANCERKDSTGIEPFVLRRQFVRDANFLPIFLASSGASWRAYEKIEAICSAVEVCKIGRSADKPFSVKGLRPRAAV